VSKNKILFDRVSLEYPKDPRGPKRLRNGENGSANGSCALVLEDIDLAIQTGEFVSILGHSGCGKSSLLKIVAGFVKPTRGSVWIDEHQVQGPRADHMFVFQEGALFPWHTILKNVSLALNGLKNESEQRREARQYLELVSLEAYEDYYPHMLSGGMRQRAELARALAAKPDVLLVDEPFSGLDYLTRLQMREEILYLHQMLDKTTILFVTHDIDEALQLSDRVVIMNGPPGRLHSSRPVAAPHPRLLSSPVLNQMRNDIYHQLGVHVAL
jgi:ABC-type nitrate/sulfonate/bicarbonate transport system ATPase subunit